MKGFIEIIIFVVVLAVGGVAIYYAFESDQKRRREADESDRKKGKEAEEFYRRIEAAYYNSLNALKRKPNNPELKQQTLAKGREYSALTRNRHGQDKTVTIFDEIALMNDINAACASAVSIQPNIENETKQAVEQRLAKLLELKEKNSISEQEYNERRQKILDEI